MSLGSWKQTLGSARGPRLASAPPGSVSSFGARPRLAAARAGGLSELVARPAAVGGAAAGCLSASFGGPGPAAAVAGGIAAPAMDARVVAEGGAGVAGAAGSASRGMASAAVLSSSGLCGAAAVGSPERVPARQRRGGGPVSTPSPSATAPASRRRTCRRGAGGSSSPASAGEAPAGSHRLAGRTARTPAAEYQNRPRGHVRTSSWTSASVGAYPRLRTRRLRRTARTRTPPAASGRQPSTRASCRSAAVRARERAVPRRVLAKGTSPARARLAGAGPAGAAVLSRSSTRPARAAPAGGGGRRSRREAAGVGARGPSARRPAPPPTMADSGGRGVGPTALP